MMFSEKAAIDRCIEENRYRLFFTLLFWIIKDIVKMIASKVRQNRRLLVATAIAIVLISFCSKPLFKALAPPPSITSSSASLALPKTGFVFCWVLTSPQYFDSRVVAVNETWLRRCDRGEFFTTEEIRDPSIPHTTVFAGLEDGYNELFWKTIKGFQHSWAVSKDFAWYLKADDDSYIVIEHLREYLDQFDPRKPLYIGYTLKPFLENGYNSGGAGYLLSNGAMKIFAEHLAENRTLCPFDIFEDLGMGRCLESAGILPVDTRNDLQQARFLPYSIAKIFSTKVHDSMYIKYRERRRFDAFAKEIISFHHQSPDELRMIEILLYRVDSPKMSRFHVPRRSLLDDEDYLD